MIKKHCDTCIHNSSANLVKKVRNLFNNHNIQGYQRIYQISHIILYLHIYWVVHIPVFF